MTSTFVKLAAPPLWRPLRALGRRARGGFQDGLKDLAQKAARDQ
jgi:hypothetical protein